MMTEPCWFQTGTGPENVNTGSTAPGQRTLEPAGRHNPDLRRRTETIRDAQDGAQTGD